MQIERLLGHRRWERRSIKLQLLLKPRRVGCKFNQESGWTEFNLNPRWNVNTAID